TSPGPRGAGTALPEGNPNTPVKVFTARPTEFPAAAQGGSAEVRTFEPKVPAAPPIQFVELKEVKSARPQLTEAKVVVSGGRGTKGDFKEIEALADELGDAGGAPRPGP